MYLALMLSVVIGSVCAVRLHVLAFMLLVLVVIAGAVIAGAMVGFETTTVLIWAVAFAVALQAGYVSVYGLIQWSQTRSRRNSASEAEVHAASKISRD